MRPYPCRLLAIAVTLLCVWGFTSCAMNPVTGQHELMLLSESDEIKLGQTTDTEIARTYGLYDDQPLQLYLENLGTRVARASHRPDLTFHFKVLDSSVVNAFAVPGGYVYITRGILAYMNNEAELAGIIGHEIGHVAARHSAQQYSRAQLAQLGLSIGTVFSQTFRTFAGLAEFGVSTLFLRFSRDNERQADDLGVEYATKAGFDADKMADFFLTLERLNPSPDSKGLPSWLSTHPDPPDRIKAVRTKASEWNQRLGTTEGQVNRDGYLQRIAGIIFGEDPRQGYVADNTFFHPGMKFQFPVPGGWKLNNTPAQVQIVHPKGEGAVLFSAVPAASARTVANKFIQETRPEVLASEAITVNGLTAQRVISDVATQQGVLRVLSLFIKQQENVYIFHGISAPSLFSTNLAPFRHTMEGFRPLTDPKRIDVKPHRIRIRTTESAGTVRAALKALNVSEQDMEKIALLNGVNLSDTVPAKTSFKVLEQE